MSDPDLDELAAELADFAAPEKKEGARRARSASSPDSRRFSGSSRNTIVSRNTGKIATSSSGCTPCASTACGRSRIAAPCLHRWTIKGC